MATRKARIAISLVPAQTRSIGCGTAHCELARFTSPWQVKLEPSGRFPLELARFLHECAATGQSKPTPPLLRHEKDGYSRLPRIATAKSRSRCGW